MLRLLGYLLVILVIISCENFFSPSSIFSPGYYHVYGPVFLDPFPPKYKTWWDEVVKCAEIDKDIRTVIFFTADSIVRHGKEAAGLRRPELIVIASRWIESATVVKHEMIHELLNGDSDHTSSLYAQCSLD